MTSDIQRTVIDIMAGRLRGGKGSGVDEGAHPSLAGLSRYRSSKPARCNERKSYMYMEPME